MSHFLFSPRNFAAAPAEMCSTWEEFEEAASNLVRILHRAMSTLLIDMDITAAWVLEAPHLFPTRKSLQQGEEFWNFTAAGADSDRVFSIHGLHWESSWGRLESLRKSQVASGLCLQSQTTTWGCSLCFTWWCSLTPAPLRWLKVKKKKKFGWFLLLKIYWNLKSTANSSVGQPRVSPNWEFLHEVRQSMNIKQH